MIEELQDRIHDPVLVNIELPSDDQCYLSEPGSDENSAFSGVFSLYFSAAIVQPACTLEK